MKNNKFSTVNLKEKEKFKDFYNEWWDLEGPFEPLHNFNEIRINFIKKTLNLENKNFYVLKNINALDVGCGGGILCEPLRRLGADITGIDINEKAIRIAKKHAEKEGLIIKYFNSDISNFQKTKKFDIIICMETIEHINNINFFIKNCKRLLKKNGFIIGSTINKTLNSYLQAIVLAENILKIIPKDTHNWNKFVDHNVLQKILILNNFSKIRFQGSFYNPVTKNWRFKKSLDVNYFFSARNDS